MKDSGGLARDLERVTTAAVSDGPITAEAAGDTGYLLRFTDDVGGTGRSALFQDGAGKIGIGTAAPAYALDLPAGEVRFGGYRTWLPYFDAQIRLGNVTPGQGTWAMGISGDVTDDFFFVKMSNGHYPFRIKYTTEDFLLATTTGNVGIGTGSPTQKLEVAGNAKVTGTLTLPVNGLVAGTNQLVLSGGNVGVGATSPAEKLEVAGKVKITGSPGTNGIIFPDSTTQTTAMRLAALTRGITFLAGCDWCGTLADDYDQPKIFYNVVGAMTINSVTCFSDTGTPVINVGKNGSNILSSNLTCSTSGASTTSFSNNALNSFDTLDFVMVTAGGAAHRVTVTIQATIN